MNPKAAKPPMRDVQEYIGAALQRFTEEMFDETPSHPIVLGESREAGPGSPAILVYPNFFDQLKTRVSN